MKKKYLAILLLTPIFLFAHTAGHEHDEERELMIDALFTLSWADTTGMQSAAILTATSPAALLIWSQGAALLIDAQQLVAAGLNLNKQSPKGFIFHPKTKQILITQDDISTITQGFRYKDAVFADFLMHRSQLVNYDAITSTVTINLGQAKAKWPLRFNQIDADHHDHDHHHDDHEHDDYHDDEQAIFLLGRTFWSAAQPLLPNQQVGLGGSARKLRMQMVINAKPLIKAGLKPAQLHSMRYEVERYGLFNLFKHERLIVEFYL